jgi:hypothetical protein
VFLLEGKVGDVASASPPSASADIGRLAKRAFIARDPADGAYLPAREARCAG